MQTIHSVLKNKILEYIFLIDLHKMGLCLAVIIHFECFCIYTQTFVFLEMWV